MKAVFKILMSGVLALGFSACGVGTGTSASYTSTGVYGGMMGAVVGAGSGAIAGALIANGDIGASALLGTAVGIPVGVVTAVAYRSYKENKEIDSRNDIIVSNEQQIITTDDRLNKLREIVVNESYRMTPDQSAISEQYDGPNLKAYY